VVNFNRFAPTIGIAMRRAAALILVFLALSACGNKAALYLPPPEPNPQQDNKPAPRQ
jgi:predicted small lipoprotein YifL